jgi:hypothetical protein
MRQKYCRTCYERGTRWMCDTIEELNEHMTHSHPAPPTDPFAPVTQWALLQRWEEVQNVIPMEDEQMAKDYLKRWTGWVKENYTDYGDKLPQLLRSETKWEVVE